MSQKAHRVLFTVSALFNWVVGLGFLFDSQALLRLAGVSPLPTEFTFVRIVGGLVFLFGFWYYRAGSDLRSVASAIWLGAIAKIMVFSVGLFDTLTGGISWQFMLFATADLIFAGLFIQALRKLNHEPG
jgi:hypothetical protein